MVCFFINNFYSNIITKMKIKKKMKNGYIEMGKINLALAEFINCEEVDKINKIESESE